MGYRLLDLFSGAGGAALGYHRAGFEVVGVDIVPQPNYPFRFVKADALTFPLDGFDAIHASPPCQGYTPMTNRHGSVHPKLVHEVRERLPKGVPHVIENVIGSRRHLHNPVQLCGSAFGLQTDDGRPLYRHRYFESSVALWSSPCHHTEAGLAVYGKADGRRLYDRKDGSILYAWASLEDGQQALGVPWMRTEHEVKEAIPPAYTEFIGQQLLEQLERVA